ncbi:MAG: hypothetical protein ABIJ09_07635 [Pseudomonadota bacterium]
MKSTGLDRGRVAGLLLVGVMAVQAAGCLVVSNRPTKGDLALLWSFEGQTSCAYAAVDEIVVSIRGQGNSENFEVVMPCAEGGGTFTGFLQGSYTVHLEGIAFDGAVLYAATLNAMVEGGHTTDLGLVDLYSTLPVPTTGSLSVDWAFLYPAGSPTLDCAYAGVDYVEVALVDGYNRTVFDQSVRCLDGPAIIDQIEDGVYTIYLSGLGSWRGRSVALYEAAPFAVDVFAGQLTVVGVVDLPRIDSQFGDVDIGWTFAGNNSCSAAGVRDITIRIYRLAPDILDDEFSVACQDEPQLRTTFVPSDYGIEIDGLDSAGHVIWGGYLEYALAPGGYVDVTVQTQPVN